MSIHETQTPSTEALEELTLEVLNRRVESLAENLNKVYESSTNYVTESLMRRDATDQAKEQNIAHGFHMLNASVANFAARFETVFRELEAKTGSNYDDLIEKSNKKTQEILQEQEKVLEDFVAQQEKAHAEAQAKLETTGTQV